MTVNVNQYTRKDGTIVTAHKRSDPDYPELKFSKKDAVFKQMNNSIYKVEDKEQSYSSMMKSAKKLSKRERERKIPLNIRLKQFGRSQRHHNLSCLNNLKSTDGVKYFVEETQSTWLIDIIESYQPKLNARYITKQVWTLKIENGEGVLTGYTPINRNVVASQTMICNDIPINSVTFHVNKGILMLPSER